MEENPESYQAFHFNLQYRRSYDTENGDHLSNLASIVRTYVGGHGVHPAIVIPVRCQRVAADAWGRHLDGS